MHKPDAELDALDLKILARYQRDTRAPAQSIGEQVGLSAAAVQRRLKQMRGAGVIVAEVAQLAPERVGYRTTCIVGVKLEREGHTENARFKNAMAQHRQVQQCYSVTGEVDFMPVVLARDIQDFEAFAHQMLYGDPNVKSFTTFVCLDRVKVGTATPIDPEDGDGDPPSRGR
ncbi:MAG TPA: Lrp/AsnC family transcriptional regulator [Kofleriaceae bacterium]|nr:Lrp/AsnC family transcriptional regulator [Kofleriaceae bacterium]